MNSTSIEFMMVAVPVAIVLYMTPKGAPPASPQATRSAAIAQEEHDKWIAQYPDKNTATGWGLAELRRVMGEAPFRRSDESYIQWVLASGGVSPATAKGGQVEWEHREEVMAQQLYSVRDDPTKLRQWETYYTNPTALPACNVPVCECASDPSVKPNNICPGGWRCPTGVTCDYGTGFCYPSNPTQYAPACNDGGYTTWTTGYGT